MVGYVLANGRYTLRSLIGRGGQGMVYLADEAGASEPVVVKILAPSAAANDQSLVRFGREAERLRSVSHPNIVAMRDSGCQNGLAYLVMEYVRGEDLGSYIARHGRLSLEQFVPIASQILKAVGHVHTRGMMMLRDIKPANIMLCQHQGRLNFVKLLDFGLATLVDEDRSTTENAVGTAGFLSPEQAEGRKIDLRVDVFALGVLFYLALSGRLPFEGDTVESVLYKTVHDQPPPLASLLPPDTNVPVALVELIESCIAKRRSARPADADAIVEAMIDAVPNASLFRLPRAPDAPRNPGGVDAIAEPSEQPRRPSHVEREDVAAPQRSRWLGGAAVAVGLLTAASVGAWFTATRGVDPDPTPAAPVSTMIASANASDANPAPQDERITGSLEIDSKPSGEVLVDGVSMGNSPLSRTIEAGRHRVRIVASDHETWDGEVLVAPGEAAALMITMKPSEMKPSEMKPSERSPAVDPRRPTRRSTHAAVAPKPGPTPASPPPSLPQPASEPGTAPGEMTRTKRQGAREIDKDVWGD